MSLFKELGYLVPEHDETRIIEMLRDTRVEKRGLSDSDIAQSIGRTEMYAAIARVKGMTFISGLKTIINPETVRKIDTQLMRRASMVPIEIDDERISIAIGNPYSGIGPDYFAQQFPNHELSVFLTSPGEINQVIEKSSDDDVSFEDLDKVETLQSSTRQQGFFALDESEGNEVRDKLREILRKALGNFDSDVTFQMDSKRFWVRCREEGVYVDTAELPLRLAPVFDSVLLQLLQSAVRPEDVNDRTVDVSGRFTLVRGGGAKSVDVRYERLRTARGFHITMRLLDKAAVEPKLGVGTMMFDTPTLDAIRQTLAAPEGMILMTGPTGSGKSTTISAMLREVNTPDYKIITLEDPVEDEIEGVVHCELGGEDQNERFMKSIVRSDPDIVFCGEIRDLISASLAIKAAMTGHLMLSTLHANSTAKTIDRLADMGVERWKVAGVLIAVAAQRLVRMLCPHCKSDTGRITERDCRDYGIERELIGTPVAVRNEAGCDSCRNGYRGRTAILEFVPINEESQTRIAKGDIPAQIMADIRAERNLPSIRESGMKLLTNKMTDLKALSEAVRISI